MYSLWNRNLLIYITLFQTVGYYVWIYYFKEQDQFRAIGSDIFSILGPLTSSVVLTFVYKNLKNKDKYFWLLILFGTFSYVIAEGIWFYYEAILKVVVPYPGWADLFYMLQIIFYLLAFLFQIWYKRNRLHIVKFVLDTFIIMTVAISFSWHFIIKDILLQSNGSFLFKFVSMGYPIGDLILILAAISIYMGSEYFFSPKVFYFLVGSLVTQVFADSAYLYLSAKSLYISGGLYDPLWTLALLLIGVAGTFAIADQIEPNRDVAATKNTHKIDFFSLKLLLPYLSVILLFIFLLIQGQEINSLMIGAAAAILLVILRQIFTLLENQTLLTNYHTLTEKLELKIAERTVEISTKNEQLLTAVNKMKHMAYHDVLSGLPNRRFFLEQLTISLAAAKRNSTKIAVIFIDLDRFKIINDTLGHVVGDLLIKYVSTEMLKNLRPTDIISRQGGDEFTILLNDITNDKEIIQYIKKIQSIVEKPIKLNDHDLHVTMSMGIAVCPRDGSSIEELLKHADMAMYSAKEMIGSSYKFFSSEMNENITRKTNLENGLRKALENDEFIIQYQPQVSITTGKIVGVEALVRWSPNDGVLISPSEFIPLAEETRLIIPIGEWVLYHACMQAKVWHDLGYHDLKLAVNLSPLQFLHENLIEMISSILERTGLNSNYLEIEITETVAVYDAEEAILKMQALRDLGVRISIDDFGTGYCSLIYLKRFPINSLKIAQPFVKDIMTNNSDRALVQAIIAMAHSLGLTVIAEGVETNEQLQTLKELQCNEIQGYLYSKPLNVEQLVEWVGAGQPVMAVGSD